MMGWKISLFNEKTPTDVKMTENNMIICLEYLFNITIRYKKVNNTNKKAALSPLK